MVVQTKYPHIVVDEKGTLRIEGTGLKLRILMAIQQANSYSPEELLEQYPELTLAKIYAALAFYHDHKEQVDQQIAEAEARAQSLRPLFEEQTAELRVKLRQLKEENAP